MKALVVILNKDNAEKLRECLQSLVNQSSRICKDFDVLILDGNSRDSSREVSESFEKKFPCIKFKVQEKLGGTGFARREACEYAVKNGYDTIIWGDSENIYSENYIEKMLERLKDCDAVGGLPVVKGGFFAHAFAWYHAIHIIFGLWKLHIPGNNKAERTRIYEICEYPESRRAEDYGFSLLMIKKGIRLKQEIVDAKVFVSLPENLKEIFQWQKSRVKGCAEALRLIDFKPYDMIAWSLFLPLFVISLLLSSIPVFAFLFLILLSFSFYIFFKSLPFIERPRRIFFFAPLFGLMIHSAFSILGLYYYKKLGSKK
uniref:Glycosyltransferase family 2 protein n=1 Tax=Archaeoglobus fulgidus TaxID=2234 RepID=A0A7J2TH11_ARCFL